MQNAELRMAETYFHYADERKERGHIARLPQQQSHVRIEERQVFKRSAVSLRL
jgi:hypothetical protein